MKNFPITILATALLATALGAQETKIYPDAPQAKTDVRQAIEKATRSHKRIILDFGGNWCGDCKALESIFQKEPNASLLKDNFILVDVNIGHFDANQDIAKQYGVPLALGVPALAVLDSHGKVLFSQKKGEFESMRTMDPGSVTTFLKHWKG